MRGFALVVAIIGFWAGSLAAQSGETADNRLPAPVLIIDNERLYADSQYGQQLRAGFEAEAEALRAENDQIVAALTEEEQELTERRPTMSVEDFRAAAEEFDTRVQEIRRARDAKEAQLQQARANGRATFFDDVRPLIGQMMIDRGALAVLDSRSVFVAVRVADITDEAIALIDANLLEPTQE